MTSLQVVVASMAAAGGPGVLSWLADHWLPLLQSVGITGGLFFTGWNIRLSVKARQLSNLFEITKSHREIWSKVFGNKALQRVLETQRDVQAEPATLDEQVFITLMILHLSALFEARSSNSMLPLERLEDDLRDFMSLPLAKSVWREMKQYQNKRFVDFVEGILRTPSAFTGLLPPPAAHRSGNQPAVPADRVVEQN